MHSGFEIPPGIQQQDNTVIPPHYLDTTQQLFLNPHHHYAAATPPYFPVHFKLGLNSNYKAAAAEDALVRGSERYRQSSLGILHSPNWHNQLADSTNKQTPFWEALPEEASNENSEIVDKQEMKQTACLVSKNSRVHFGELEAIYNRVGTTTESSTQTCPSHLAVGLDEAEEEEEASGLTKKKKKKRRKKMMTMEPTAEFLGKLVERVMDHQEMLQKKFVEVVGRLDEETREREEAWRKQELAHFEREAEARLNENKMAMAREAIIVSYLEKFTGETINFPS